MGPVEVGGNHTLLQARLPPQTTWRQCRGTTIQLPYPNNFSSIREYSRAFENNEIDFAVVIGSLCPLCGNRSCFRQISPYERTASDVDLDACGTDEIHTDRVHIARFLCRKTLRTFSLLPCQLLPYHRYTVATIVLSLLLAHNAAETDHRGLCAVAEQWLPADSVITGWLLACWLNVIVAGFRQGHAWLAKRYNLRRVSSAMSPAARLGEMHTYCDAIFARAPPTPLDVLAVAGAYGRANQRFLFGSPSQSRGQTHAQ